MSQDETTTEKIYMATRNASKGNFTILPSQLTLASKTYKNFVTMSDFFYLIFSPNKCSDRQTDKN